MKTLNDYAREMNVSYVTAWRRFRDGKISDAKKDERGNIVIGQPQNVQIQTLGTPIAKNISFGEPLAVPFYEAQASTGTRRNAASTIVRTDRFKNIEDGLSPFQFAKGNIPNNSNVTIRDAITLCQLAYYNYSIFRNIIDLLVDLSTSTIYLEGSTKAARDFFEAYFKKINLASLTEIFMLEYYRSGNVFLYAMNAKIQEDDLRKITQTFGITKAAAKDIEIPSKYIILNPADIEITGSSSFTTSVYQKILSAYELSVLRNPRTPEDEEIVNNLAPDIKEQITKDKSNYVILPLDMDKLYAVFYKKAHYEPFSVPIGFSVLSDLNFKAEMRQCDASLMRTVNQCVLLINIGYLDKDGGYQYSQKMAESVEAIFRNESVGRVLIVDFSVKAQFLIPDIANILNPAKYQQVETDIREGLNNILMNSSGEKFANKAITSQLFIQRLVQARESFLNQFLIPEIRRISKLLNFRTYPMPVFEDFELSDTIELTKLFLRGHELGLTTAEETLTAIRSGRMPTPEDSLESQQKFAEQKKKGLYQPLVGGPQSQLEVVKEQSKQQIKMTEMQQEHEAKQQRAQNNHDAAHPIKQPQPIAIHLGPKPKVSSPSGRPSGTKSPKTKQKTTPVGKGSIEETIEEESTITKFSAQAIKNTVLLASQLESQIEQIIREKSKIKKNDKLSEVQAGIVSDLTTLILINEEKDNWLKREIIEGYIKEPFDKNDLRVAELNEIAYTHQLGQFEAAILLNSKIDNNEKTQEQP